MADLEWSLLVTRLTGNQLKKGFDKNERGELGTKVQQSRTLVTTFAS
jgi:hypothetical protein